MHARRAALSPITLRGHKDLRLRFDELRLLVRKQLHHAPSFVEIAERGKNFPANAEVRMVHVRALHGLRKAQRHLSKIARRHRNYPGIATSLKCVARNQRLPNGSVTPPLRS